MTESVHSSGRNSPAPCAFPWLKGVWIPVGFFLAGFLAYGMTLHAFFLSDDFNLLREIVRNGPLGVWWGDGTGFVRPVISLSLYVDHALWGLNPLGYHVTNVVFHVFNSLLVCVLASQLLKGREEAGRVAIAAGLGFLLLHSHTEAVSWISGRTDVIGAFFSLASLAMYLAFRERSSLPWLTGSYASFLLAIFSKEIAVTIPVIVVICEGWLVVQRKASVRSALAVVLGFAVLSAGYLCVRAVLIGNVVGGYGSAMHLNFSPALLVRNLAAFPLRILVPSAVPGALAEWIRHHGGAGAFAFLRHHQILFAVTPAALAAVAFGLMRRRMAKSPAWPHGSLAFLFLLAVLFVVSLLPVLNLGVSMISSEGERLLYYPSAFLLLLLAAAAGFVIRRPRLYVGAACALSLVSVIFLQCENRLWRQSSGLSRSVLSSVVKFDLARPLLFLNLPDHIRGVPVYRSSIALASAIRLFCDPAYDTGRLKAVLFNDLLAPGDGADVRALGDGSFRLSLDNPLARFLNTDDPVLAPRVTPDFELVDVRRGSFIVRITPDGMRAQRGYYSRGQLWVIPEGGREASAETGD